jgi:protein-tyrosine phosphatase
MLYSTYFRPWWSIPDIHRYSLFLPIPAVTARVHMFPQDDGVSSMLPFLDSACDFIHQQRQRGAVLVHCKGGINRSPCLVVAYLMKYEQLALAEALELCSLARPVAR